MRELIPVQQRGRTPLAEHQDPIAEQRQFRQFRGDQHNRQSLLRQRPNQTINLCLGAHIDSARRFVQQQDPRLG